MSDFEALQAAIARHAAQRQADALACETLLQALYHALRGAGGPGQPLNNVTMELVPDPFQRLRPPPVGEYHAAWFRLGLCEVLLRVRHIRGQFEGEYGPHGVFSLSESSEEQLWGLARQLLRDLSQLYGDGPAQALN